MLNQTFESTAKIDSLLNNSLSVWFKEEVEPYKVILYISSEVAQYFKRKPISKSQILKSVHQDGSMEISIEITDNREIIPFVKHWIPHINVLEPKSIKDTIRKDLEVYLKIDD